MTGHIALEGFVLTAEEWAELAPELDEPWLSAATPTITFAEGSGPTAEPDEDAIPVAISVSSTGTVVVGT